MLRALDQHVDSKKLRNSHAYSIFIANVRYILFWVVRPDPKTIN